MYQCQSCEKSFTTRLGLSGHQRMHGESKGAIQQIYCCSMLTKEQVNVNYLEVHDESYLKRQETKTTCKQCSKEFIPKYGSVFCSHSCSASYTNSKRIVKKGGKKIFSCIECNKEFLASNRSNPNKARCESCKLEKKPKREKEEPIICGDYSKIIKNTCFHCKDTFFSRKKLKYCSNHREMYSESAKQGYKFTFNIYDYPEMFDLALLKQFGWYSPGGKHTKWDINGLSRDHKVSVNESIRNGYDPFYISHPLNCDLIPHSLNNKKKTRSSMTYKELVSLVDAYESSKLARKATIPRPGG